MFHDPAIIAACALLVAALVGGCTGVVKSCSKYVETAIDARTAALTERVQANSDRLGRQGAKLDGLQNGEGDKKIRQTVLAMIGDGTLIPGPAMVKATASATNSPTEGKETVSA